MPTLAKVTIAGKTYPLRFEYASLIAMEEKHGVNVFNRDVFKPSPKLTAVLVWGGVIHAAPELKLEDVVNGLSIKKMDAYGASALKVLVETLNEPETADTPAT